MLLGWPGLLLQAAAASCAALLKCSKEAGVPWLLQDILAGLPEAATAGGGSSIGLPLSPGGKLKGGEGALWAWPASAAA